MKLFDELKRRNVIRVAVAYVAAAWLLIQVVETLFPIYGLTDDAIRIVVASLAVGFVPVLVIAWLIELTPEGLKWESSVAADADSRIRAHRLMDRIIMVALGLAVVYFGFDKLVLDPAEDRRIADQARSAAIAENYTIKSIAVLPFVNMSPDPDQAFFADGISEELLNLLARIPELRVISRSSAFSFRGEKIDVRDVAEQLDVSHILEGSVRVSGDAIRITAQLIDARTDTHLWSQTYDRHAGEIFAIQDDVATRVVAELESRLLDKVPTLRGTDPEVYALFLKARSLAYAANREFMFSAEAMLRRAVKIDPQYAPAWSTLAKVIGIQTSPTEDLYAGEFRYSRSEGARQMGLAYERALAADPTDGTANMRLGMQMFFYQNDTNGVRLIEKALLSEPSNVEVLRLAGNFARAIGHWDTAVELGRRTITLDPFCQQCYWNLVITLTHSGRLDEDEALARQSIDLFGNSGEVYLGTILLLSGDAAQALTVFDKLDGDARAHGRVFALHSLGRDKEAQASFAKFLEISRNPTPTYLAWLHAWLGNLDEAFEYLDSSWHADPKYFRGDFLSRAAWNPIYQKLHGDPRWQAYWEAAQSTPEKLQSMEFQITLP